MEIIGIKASLNLGLNLSLREAFPDVVVVNRPEFKGPLHPLWIAGFISGDGSFNIKISSSLSTRSGKRIQLRFGVGLK